MNKNSSNSKFKFSGTLLLLLLTLLAGALFLYRKIGIKPKAAPGVPILSYAVDPTPLASGQNFDLILKVNPNGASFYAFELYTSFDSTKVEFQNAADPAQNISSSYLLVKSEVDSVNNLITIVGTRTGSPFSGSSDLPIARVKMRVKAGVSGDVVFNWGNNTKLGSNIAIEKVDGTFTIGGGGMTAPYLVIDIPSVINSTAQRGQNVDTQILLNTNDKQVKSTDIILFYDDTRLTFQNTVDLAQNIEINPASGFDTQLAIKNVDPSTKKIAIALQTQTPVQSNTDIVLATIKFVVKLDAPDGLVELVPETTSTIYDLQTQNILACVGGYKLTVGQSVSITPPGPSDTPGPSPTPGPSETPGPSPTPGPSETPGPSPTPTISAQSVVLNLKLKLQGILTLPNQPNNLAFKVTVNSIRRSITRSIITDFSVDNNAVWSGQAVFNGLPSASDYKIYTKGPKHLQKRICERFPQETFPGIYNCEDGAISLKPGTYNLDFTGIFQLVGDLSPQDGVVNSYDISLVRNNIAVAGSYDPAILDIADLNLDGIVDSQDYSLVIAALSIRSDEGL